MANINQCTKFKSIWLLSHFAFFSSSSSLALTYTHIILCHDIKERLLLVGVFFIHRFSTLYDYIGLRISGSTEERLSTKSNRYAKTHTVCFSYVFFRFALLGILAAQLKIKTAHKFNSLRFPIFFFLIFVTLSSIVL